MLKYSEIFFYYKSQMLQIFLKIKKVRKQDNLPFPHPDIILF